MSTTHTWRAGDRALCVKQGAWVVVHGAADTYPTPTFGTIYLIAGMYQHGSTLRLRIAGFNDAHWFNAKHFRKVVPACDRITHSRSQPQP